MYVKFFPSLKAYWAALISDFFGLQSDTSFPLQNHGYRASASLGVPAYVQFSLALIAPIHGGMARLS